MNKTRRMLLASLGLALGASSFSRAQAVANTLKMATNTLGNFHYIYNDEQHREEFHQFLINVFNLYPDSELHQLIYTYSKNADSDREIYQKLQANLSDITPFLGDLRYSLPALAKQKAVMGQQTNTLLPTDRRYEGYLEVGSTGRYLDALEESLDIQGERFFLTDKPASYSPVDMIDRGQLFKAGEDIALNQYQSELSRHLASKSLDLVTVYIGFHHCPVPLREAFIGNIRDAMSDDGVLILRDHDARNTKMQHMVALAHDVFNMGTNESWQYNQDELRHFYSLDELQIMMRKFGFKTDGRRLYQQGDPTRNALMAFTKA